MTNGDADAQPGDRVGARARRRRRDARRRQLLHRQLRPAAAGDLPPRRRRRAACCRTTLAEQPVHEGQFRFAGVDDHYFIAAAVEPGPGARRVPAGDAARRRASTQRQLLAQTFRFPQPPQNVRFFVGPKQFDAAARRRCASWSARSTSASSRAWSCRCSSALKWIYGFVGNYGWAIIVLTILHQPRDLPAAAQERRVDAEDAGAAAADEGDSGSLRGPEGDRPGAAEDEHGDHESLPREGREPGERLRADAAARCRCCLRSTRCSRRSIELRGAPFVGCGSTICRQPIRIYVTADADGRHDVLAAEDHADDRRSGAAADHDDDAAHVHRRCSCGRRAAW